MKKAPFLSVPLLFFLFISKGLTGQCYSTSWQEGTNFSIDNSIGQYNFSLPGNVQTSNNSRSSASSIISILTADTHYLVVKGFNFSVPSYVSVCGVTVEIESRATGLLLTAAVRDNEVRLVRNNVITGSNRALAGDWGSSDGYRSFGGASDLWGTTLTPGDVNDAGFGVAISARIIALVAALPDAEIDHIRMRLDLNPILPVNLAYFRAVKKGSIAELEWKTTEEEPGAVINLQRKIANGSWDILKSYELSGHLSYTSYKAYDTVPGGGICQYRLQTVLLSGNKNYSLIQTLDLENTIRHAAWPNPATNRVTVMMKDAQVRDMYGRRLSLPVHTRDGISTIMISNLPPGIYFADDGKRTIRFIKE